MVSGSRSASLEQNLGRQMASRPPCPAPGSLACATSLALGRGVAVVWGWTCAFAEQEEPCHAGW